MQLYAQFELKLMTLLCTRRRSPVLGRDIFFCIQATTGVLLENRLLCTTAADKANDDQEN